MSTQCAKSKHWIRGPARVLVPRDWGTCCHTPRFHVTHNGHASGRAGRPTSSVGSGEWQRLGSRRRRTTRLRSASSAAGWPTQQARSQPPRASPCPLSSLRVRAGLDRQRHGDRTHCGGAALALVLDPCHFAALDLCRALRLGTCNLGRHRRQQSRTPGIEQRLLGEPPGWRRPETAKQIQHRRSALIKEEHQACHCTSESRRHNA
jgi:hypothetical protein